MSIFSERLRAAREKQGWTIQELADYAHVSYAAIYRTEQGVHAAPRVDIAARLALALGVSLDYLAGLQDAAPTTPPDPSATPYY